MCGLIPRKRSSLLQVVAAALALSYLSPACSVGFARETAMRQVKCALTMEKTGFVLGEPVVAAIKLINEGDRPIFLHKPTLDGQFPVELRITRIDNGSTLGFAGESGSTFPPFIEIAPGESIEEGLNVSRSYEVHSPGEYKMYAVYNWDVQDPNGCIIIESEEVVLQVEKPNGRFQERLSIDTRLADGSAGQTVNWHVFTHRVGDAVHLYCRRFIELRRLKGALRREAPLAFVDLGEPREESIDCMVDTSGKMHVLFKPASEAEDICAHAVLRTLGELESRKRYRSEKNAKPSLATQVYVQYAQKAAEQPQEPDNVALLTSKDTDVRDRAVDSILADRAEIVKQLTNFIEPANAEKYSDETVVVAGYLLGEFRAKEAVPALSRALRKPRGRRWSTTDINRYDMPMWTALVKIGRPSAPAMIENIETSDSKRLMNESATVLWHVLGGKKRVLELLDKLEARATERGVIERIKAARKYIEPAKEDREPLY